MEKQRVSKVAALISALCLVCTTVGIAGCAPQQAAKAASADNQQVVVDFIWSEGADCATCHQTEAESATDNTCLASIHDKEGATCTTCHTDKTGLQKAHEGATPENAKKKATKLRDTEIDEQACFSCHESYEELAAKTIDSTALTDSEGTIENPHALPENADHADTTCSSCHVMHSDTPASESAPGYCLTCHHQDIYQCHTCHD